MDVSAVEIVLGIVLLMCAVGAVYGARWVSRRSDEQMERTRAALRARHAVPERPPVPSQQVVVPQPPRGGDLATRQLSRADPAASTSPVDPAVSLSRVDAAASPSRADPAVPVSRTGSTVSSSAGTTAERASADAADDDPDSSGRHRVPEELMRAATYSLSPDRVARAKVPGPRPRREQDRLTDRRS